MVEDTNPSQDKVDITGHVILDSISYEKDVMEIKLPDTVISSDYDGNFVKDVCIDEGVLPHWKISEEKIVNEKSSPNFDSLIDANGYLEYEREDNARKTMHGLEPETVPLPAVGFPPDGNKDKQCSLGKKYDDEDRSTAIYSAGDLNDKKISLEELLRLESAEESRRTETISSESSENHMLPVHEEAAGQVSINDFHGVEATTSRDSELVNNGASSNENTNGCSSTTSEYWDAAEALDVRGPDQDNDHNHFFNHGSLEGTCKPECSILSITNAPSTELTCIVGRTDSFSDLVGGSKGFNEVQTTEPRADNLNSTSSGLQSSEKSNDHSKSPASKAITETVDETAVHTSSSDSNAEPIYANGENHKKGENEGISDEHDFSQIDDASCVGTFKDDDTVSKGSTHAEKDTVVEQTVPDSAKVAARIGNGYPFEPGFFGPSIMSGPVSNSGHIAYSGNVSLRSDSSTTSTRSFAFPVLQRDWISSPVRMAKADRRRNRRRRGWRKGLLCCRF